MRNIAIIILITCYSVSYSQDLSHIHNKDFQWSQVEVRPFNAADVENLRHLHDKYFSFIDSDNLPEYLPAFHLVDYDNDYDLDIFYHGWSGAESEILHIIENTGKTFEVVQSIWGAVKEVRYNNNRIEEIEVYDYACCAGYVNHLQLWKQDESSAYQVVNDLAIIGIDLLTDRLDKPVRFQVINTKYNMRTQPEIRELRENEGPFTPIDGQNISATFVAGNTGTAIAEKEDNTGRIWWLVIMDHMPDTQYPTIFYPGNNETESYKPVGWISSRFVEVLGE